MIIEGKRRERLIKDLEKLKKAELIERCIEIIDSNAETSKRYYELLGELSFAEQRIEELEEELKQVKKNDRGAGRKEKFDNEQRDQILKARKEGKSIRTIAKEFNCSAGLIHKLTKNIDEEM